MLKKARKMNRIKRTEKANFPRYKKKNRGVSNKPSVSMESGSDSTPTERTDSPAHQRTLKKQDERAEGTRRAWGTRGREEP
jgi:hypothetical protein